MHIVCVGAIYIDTILTVPHFPVEDQKLRASKRTRRRGGNCGNTLEVLTQLTQHLGPTQQPQLYLIAVLPSYDSPDTKLIRSTLPNVELDSCCIYRLNAQEAASSYIIQNAKNDSRTIVSINELAEMTVEEFSTRILEIAVHRRNCKAWYHFEGRVPEITFECVEYLRQISAHNNTTISVELEKPERTDLSNIVPLANVLFYSKLWATTNGFSSAREFLLAQLPATREGSLLCCTWGSGGATLVQKSSDADQWVSVEAWQSPQHPVIDTIGAGDTFIAGMLYMLTCAPDLNLLQQLSFANELAGRKVTQEGFNNLGLTIHG